MTKKEAIKKLNKLKTNDAYSIENIFAIDILCDFLASIGHKDIVDEYYKIYGEKN